MKRLISPAHAVRVAALLTLMFCACFVAARAQNIDAQYRTIADYGSGFSGEIKIINNGSQAISGWTLAFDFNRNFNSIYDAQIISHVGTRYTVGNVGFNAAIPAGGSVTFGFTGSPGNVSVFPTNYVFNGAGIGVTETTFTYQGKLNDGAAAANGVYDLQFALYDEGGTAIGTAQTLDDVTVTNGIFTVKLDFGAAAFPGANRFLEIRVRQGNSTGAYTILAPRQPVTRAPYAIRAISAATADAATNAANAAQLGGTDANQFVQTSSAAFIRNQTTQQTGDFNISGNGTAGGTLAANNIAVTNGATLNDSILRIRAAADNSQGIVYSPVVDGPEFRAFAGFRWTNGSSGATERMRLDTNGNLTVGGAFSASGAVNSATQFNLGGNRFASNKGTENTFVGIGAGTISNNAGGQNTYFGFNAGASNTQGSGNSFFGRGAGIVTTGGGNVFVGSNAGSFNVTGSSNTLIGANANFVSGADNLTYATAIGADALASENNSIVLGRNTGTDNVRIPGKLKLGTFASGGISNVCFNNNLEISTCSSSLRYKTNIAPYNFGLNLVNLLRPITFDWKDGGIRDFGLGAEDVAAIEPLLVNYSKSGEIEGVKYDRIGVLLLNAVKEQQGQIEAQQKQINEQKQMIEELKRLVCLNNTACQK